MRQYLDEATEIVQWMREHHVRSAKIGAYEIELADMEPTWVPMPEDRPPPEQKPKYDDPLDDPQLYGGEVPNFRLPDDKK